MSDQPNNSPKTIPEYVRLFFSGMAMGAADIVPGVSGGTMAFILDIYEDLLNAIKSFNTDVIRLLLQFKIKEALSLVHWRFLLAVGGGIGTSILAFSGILSWTLDNEPEFLFAFFFGLVLASVIAIGVRIENWKPIVLGSLVGGAVAAYIIVGAVPAQADHDPLTLFLSGTVAIMAMILPGISGSFILLILGQYEYVLESVTELRILDLSFVAMGCVVGIVFFSRLLSWLLTRYRDIVIAVLVGFMVGSLRKIWPWKETLETAIDRHGETYAIREKNILPDLVSAEFALALALFILGIVLVSFIEHQKSKSNPVVVLLGRLMGKKSVATVEAPTVEA